MDKPDFPIEISVIQRHFKGYNRTGRTKRETQRRIMFLRSSVRLQEAMRSSVAYDFKNSLHMFRKQAAFFFLLRL